MDSALTWDRLQFAFTATFHYLFPQLTMGLALLVVILMTMALRTGNEHYQHAALFWFIPGMLLVIAYTVFAHRKFAGRVGAEDHA